MKNLTMDTQTVLKKMLIGTLIVLSVALIAFVVMETRNTARAFNYIGQSADEKNEITVSGVGEMVVVPDVAKLQVGTFTVSKDVVTAQEENTVKMNSIIDALEALGIDKKDVKTSYYYVNPEYDYVDGRQTLRGYRVSQAVDITIREVANASTILSKSAELGANDIGSLRFEVDNIEKVKQDARIQALGNAKEKAEEMARALDVKLGRITSFTEDTVQPYEPPVMFERALAGSYADSEAVAAPTIEVGSSEIRATVYVSFELL